MDGNCDKQALNVSRAWLTISLEFSVPGQKALVRNSGDASAALTKFAESAFCSPWPRDCQEEVNISWSSATLLLFTASSTRWSIVVVCLVLMFYLYDLILLIRDPCRRAHSSFIIFESLEQAQARKLKRGVLITSFKTPLILVFH